MANLPAAKWFADEIVTGLQRLFVLSLKGTPAAETITATATIWVETLWEVNIAWGCEGRIPDAAIQQEDCERIRMSFKKLARECDYFPSPKVFLEHLPARKAKLALPLPEVPPERVQEYLRKLRDITGSKR